jgi:hypothetical protein
MIQQSDVVEEVPVSFDEETTKDNVAAKSETEAPVMAE